jgi:hypothetical protein
MSRGWRRRGSRNERGPAVRNRRPFAFEPVLIAPEARIAATGYSSRHASVVNLPEYFETICSIVSLL